MHLAFNLAIAPEQRERSVAAAWSRRNPWTKNFIAGIPVAVALCIQTDKPFKSRSRISAENS